MANQYLYGLVGRHIKIGKDTFYGYKLYSTKDQAQKIAEGVRASSSGRLARIIPTGTRYVVMVSKKKGER